MTHLIPSKARKQRNSSAEVRDYRPLARGPQAKNPGNPPILFYKISHTKHFALTPYHVYCGLRTPASFCLLHDVLPYPARQGIPVRFSPAALPAAGPDLPTRYVCLRHLLLPYDGTHRPLSLCHSPAHAAACPAPLPSPDKAAQPRSCSSTVAASRPSVALARPYGELPLPPAGLHPSPLIPLLSRPLVKGIEPNSPQHPRLPLSRQRREPADRPEQKFFQGWMGARGKAGTVFTKNVPACPRQTRSAPTFRHVPSLFFPPSLSGDQPMKRRKKGGMSRPCPASDPSLPPSGDGRDITTKKRFTAPQGSGPARPVR